MYYLIFDVVIVGANIPVLHLVCPPFTVQVNKLIDNVTFNNNITTVKGTSWNRIELGLNFVHSILTVHYGPVWELYNFHTGP